MTAFSTSLTAVESVKNLSQATPIHRFFQLSAGQWHSERRYYTLPKGETKSVQSQLSIQFLPQGCSELVHLAELHHLETPDLIECGSWVRWESYNLNTDKLESRGETVFGASGSLLYRDRGYATHRPITAAFHLSDPDTLCLCTTYNDDVFEEELKLIGQLYRTRQTIASRAGAHCLIGQYLEKRLPI